MSRCSLPARSTGRGFTKRRAAPAAAAAQAHVRTVQLATAARHQAGDSQSRKQRKMSDHATERRMRLVWPARGRRVIAKNSWTFLGAIMTIAIAFTSVPLGGGQSQGFPDSHCCFTQIIDQPAYSRPSEAAFWAWHRRSEFPDAEVFGHLRGTAYYLPSLSMQAFESEVRGQVATGRMKTAVSYLTSLGMLCQIVEESTTSCLQTLRAAYVCHHLKALPSDYANHRQGLLRIELTLKDDRLVAARSNLTNSEGGFPCAING